MSTKTHTDLKDAKREALRFIGRRLRKWSKLVAYALELDKASAAEAKED